MMINDTNPFENDKYDYIVLINEEGQYSLWAKFIEIPDGWNNVYGPHERLKCLTYIEKNWNDMRPKSLIQQDSFQ